MTVRPLLASFVLLAASAALARAGDPAPAPKTPAPAPAPSAPAPAPKLESIWLEATVVEVPAAAAVEKAILGVKGVRSFEWIATGAEAKVVREAGVASDASIVEAAKGAGATAPAVVPTTATTLTFVEPLHCAGCARNVTRALKAVAGVKDVSIPDSFETVAVTYDARSVTVAALEKALADAEKPVKPSK